MRAMLTWVRGGPSSRARATVTASKGRSGRAAVRASRRSHAWRRWWRHSLEKLTAWTTSPRTSATVPTRRVPSARVTLTSSDIGSRSSWAAGGDDLDVGDHPVQDRVGEGARGQNATRPLGGHACVEVGAGHAGGEQPFAEAPSLQGVELDRQGVVDVPETSRPSRMPRRCGGRPGPGGAGSAPGRRARPRWCRCRGAGRAETERRLGAGPPTPGPLRG